MMRLWKEGGSRDTVSAGLSCWLPGVKPALTLRHSGNELYHLGFIVIFSSVFGTFVKPDLAHINWGFLKFILCTA